MSEVAPEVKETTTSLEGLEEVFTGDDSPAHPTPTAQVKTAQDIEIPQDTAAQDWTVDETAKALGISAKTVLRRLQKGSLMGYKVSGQFGPEWRVTRLGTDSPAHPIAIAQVRTAQDFATPRDTPAQDANPLAELKAENAELKARLEGAIYRNGYLEAKLDERNQQIKVLTDSQHRVSWWHRFCSWALARPGV